MRSTRSAPSGSSRRSQGGSPRTEPCVNRLGAMDFDLTSEQQSIRKLAKEEQKQRWLPRLCKGEVIGCFGLTEPEVGSDATKLRTSAKRDGDSWVLRGRKMWISNGSVSGLALVFAQADASKEDKGITAFVLERDRQPYGSQALHGKLGLRSSDSSELILEDVRVPDANRLGDVGQGFKIAMSAL